MVLLSSEMGSGCPIGDEIGIFLSLRRRLCARRSKQKQKASPIREATTTPTTTPIIVPRWLEPEVDAVMVLGTVEGVVEFSGGGGVCAKTAFRAGLFQVAGYAPLKINT